MDVFSFPWDLNLYLSYTSFSSSFCIWIECISRLKTSIPSRHISPRCPQTSQSNAVFHKGFFSLLHSVGSKETPREGKATLGTPNVVAVAPVFLCVHCWGIAAHSVSQRWTWSRSSETPCNILPVQLRAKHYQ